MNEKKPKVIIRKCERYDTDAVERIVRECFADLAFTPCGNVLIKPNIVTANRHYIHHSYTHPAVVGGLIRVLKHNGIDGKRITIGESSGYGIPPGLFMYESGYAALAKRMGVKIVDFNEDDSEWVDLKRSRAHPGFNVAKSIMRADTKIWATKLKYHICCQVTNALKLNIGLLQHRDRMKFHDDRLNEKIVDMLEIGYPDVVVTDAIVIGHGYESAPRGIDLGVVMVADDPLAADAVAAFALGYEPADVVHLRIAAERGYGSINLDDFDISGDTALDELRDITRGVESEYQDIHKVKTPIKFYCGYSPGRKEFCYGGCLAAVKGCLGTIDKRRPGSVAAARPGAIVTGINDCDVIHPGQTVVLVGDCTKVTGRLEAAKVKRLKGCPIGTSQLIFGLPGSFGLPSPASDADAAVKFVYFTLRSFFRRITLKIRSIFS